MNGVECINTTAFWPIILFWIGGISLTFLLAKRNGFGLKDAILVMIGLRKAERSPFIVVLHVAVLLVPLALWLWLIEGCKQSVL
jgi:hypothetical protein